MFCGGRKVFFLAGAVNDQLAFGLGGFDQICRSADNILGKRGNAAQQHRQGKQNSKQFFHNQKTSFYLFRRDGPRRNIQ